jgi:DNA gyrase subunit B
MADKFIDDEITHIVSDIKKIQTKPTMYISYLGAKGALHLCYELINNAIDECINTNSPGDTINIHLDESENTITVTDNGRGINEKDVQVVCTFLQSGSKFTREGTGHGSAGENGCGITACNALSERFEIIVTRYGKRTTIGFTEGKLTSPLTTKTIKDTKSHGTTFIVKPSKLYMGDDCDIIADDLIGWIGKIIYLVPSNITINLSVKKKGKESTIVKKYKNTSGLYEYCKILCKNETIDPVHLRAIRELKEEYHGRTIDRFVAIEYAFTYDTTSVELLADSFCNFVNTIENGVHVDAVRTALIQILTKATKDSLSEKDSKKLDITASDVTQGLVLTVYLSTNYPPMFTSQTKHKVGNNELFKPIRSIAYDGMMKYFDANPKVLKKLCDRVKTNAKARLEATKVRNSVIRGESNNLAEHLMDNFAPCNNRGKDEYKELFIIEGKSAKGTASRGRFDRDTQAIYSLRGVPLNSYGVKTDKVLANTELEGLVKIQGCNIGSKFDINKLKYNKIIIMADSDSDGYNITSLMCAFYMCHFRPLVEAGIIYKAVSPLYELKDKNNRYIHNKGEYISVFEKNIKSKLKLTTDNGKPLSDVVFHNLIRDNVNYLDELISVATSLSINPMLLEYICIHRNDKDFYKKFRKKYPELTIKDGILSGVFDDRYQILIMDDIYYDTIKPIIEFIDVVNKGTMYYKVEEKTSDDYVDHGIISLGEVMTLAQKYRPIIVSRFKGLGELDPEELRDTTLDPNNRILIRLTTEDMEREMDIFDTLHGDDSDARKAMMERVRITKEDLDN